MKIAAKLPLVLVALATIAAPAGANWRHHRHDCGWGKHHHMRCG